MGDTFRDEFSDRGSIPLRSIKTGSLYNGGPVFFKRKGIKMKKKRGFLPIAITVLCFMLTFALTGCGMKNQEPGKEKQARYRPGQ